ncbi:hypothetical protein SAMN04488128_104213 [Chitinophaga eiseniae]|uniref:Uncharacterized protein n=1 Tax=Chitinophaga eiseniae TaxID=634771 RepID=A0A1T4T9C6_9BACT|nr:hypothetical protein [Chitinophaga eiseniae]SKA37046.1 hypothetical protein SAMN04488128_104213 [Chitinophaga eiseniae]
MKQIFFGAFMLSAATAAAQEGNVYRMATAGLHVKTIDGGRHERTYYVLRFDAGKAGLCTYTLITEQQNAALSNTLIYNDWQYFKYQKKHNRLSIAGLPPSCAAWATLQPGPHALTSVKNKNILFEQLTPPPAGFLPGNSYAAPIDTGHYLVLTFGKDTAEIAYMKNITSKNSQPESDESRKARRYRWTIYGTDVLIPEYGLFLTADFDTQQLRLLYDSKYITLTRRTR